MRGPAPSSTLLAGAQRGEPNAAVHPCAMAFPPSDRFRLSLTRCCMAMCGVVERSRYRLFAAAPGVGDG